MDMLNDTTKMEGRKMKNTTFDARFTWSAGGSFEAEVRIGADGWGSVYDKANGLYCGSISPIRVMQLRGK